MIVKMWDNHAPMYAQVWERSTSQWGRDALVLGQLPSTKASPPPRFLDVACGTGSQSMTAASLGFDVTAIDISPGMMASLEAKMAASASPLRITTRIMDGQTLHNLEDNSFDIVSSVFGNFLFPDRMGGWASALRVLKPGGRMLTTSWDGESANVRLFHYVFDNAADKPEATHQKAIGPAAAMNPTFVAATFQSELEANGFTDVDVYTVSHPMCFKSGRELVDAIFDCVDFKIIVGPKEESSAAHCILDYAQFERQGVKPMSETAKAMALASSQVPVENHPLWNKPIALRAIGHIAIATKPHIK